MYAEDHTKYGTERDAFIYVAVNAYWEEQYFTFPLLPEGFRWNLAFEAYGISTEAGSRIPMGDSSGIRLGSRTTAVLIATHEQ